MEKSMYRRGLAGRAYVFAMIVSFLAPAICAGQAGGAKVLTGDQQAIHDYILTMDKVSKYVATATKLVAATKTDPVLADEVKKIGDAKVPNLEKVLMAQQSPHVAAFLKTNGITERDFVMTPLTWFSAQDAFEGQMNHKPVQDFINPANLKFVREHQSELEKYQKASAGTSSASD